MESKHIQEIAKARLKVGAWYSIEYGFGRRDFCVIAIKCGVVLLENPRWLLSDSEWMTTDEFFGRSNPIFLGYGKRRPIGSRIRRLTDCFCTLYSKPSL